MIRTTLLVALVALFLCSGASPAAAQDPDEPMKTAAKALYNEARAARKVDDFATCYAKASAAWAIHKHATVAALVGDCGVGVGKYRDAAEKLKSFFDSTQKTGSEELRSHLEARLDEAKKHIAVVILTVSVPDAVCDVDGKRVEALPATVFLDPGSHAFEARHPDFETETRQLTVSAGTNMPLRLELKPKAQAAPVETPPKKEEGGNSYLVYAGVAGAVGAGGLVLMVASLVLHGGATDDLEEAQGIVGGNDSTCGVSPNTQGCSALQSAADDQSTFAGLFPVGIVIATVGVAGSAAFLGLHFSSDDGDAEASLHVSPTGLVLRGRF